LGKNGIRTYQSLPDGKVAVTSAKSFEEAKRAILSHVAARIPHSHIEELLETRKGRRYAVLKVTSNGHHVDIYIYDDGDFGFTAEDGAWYPLEIWDEKDDGKRLERLFRMLESHTVMFDRQQT